MRMQGLAGAWLQQREAAAGLRVLDARAPDLLRELEAALALGALVLLQARAPPRHALNVRFAVGACRTLGTSSRGVTASRKTQ